MCRMLTFLFCIPALLLGQTDSCWVTDQLERLLNWEFAAFSVWGPGAVHASNHTYGIDSICESAVADSGVLLVDEDGAWVRYSIEDRPYRMFRLIQDWRGHGIQSMDSALFEQLPFSAPPQTRMD